MCERGVLNVLVTVLPETEESLLSPRFVIIPLFYPELEIMWGALETPGNSSLFVLSVSSSLRVGTRGNSWDWQSHRTLGSTSPQCFNTEYSTAWCHDTEYWWTRTLLISRIIYMENVFYLFIINFLSSKNPNTYIGCERRKNIFHLSVFSVFKSYSFYN